jgi:hypothetical protein
MAVSNFPRFEAPRPSFEFDSTKVDRLTLLLGRLEGLAGCVTAIGSIDRDLAADALPMLGDAMHDIAKEAKALAEDVWAQSETYRAAARGEQ